MFEAKQELEFVKKARRNRDNRRALIWSAAAIALAVVLQVIYFGVGPGHVVAKPTPSSSASNTPASANQGNVPAANLAEGKTWAGTIDINGAKLGISVFGKEAPQAASSFISLASKGFFKDTKCHRLTTSNVYILQCGDPKANGTGGPGYSFGPLENTPANQTYATGELAMARQGNNASSMGSQFFIVYKTSKFPNDSVGGYTIFGKVTSGLNGLDPIVQAGTKDKSADGTPALTPIINSVVFSPWPTALKPAK
jgi:peptidyl-prolyl cis-trans isomerase B (cyclophilin B)